MSYLLDANTLACALNDSGGVRPRLNDAESRTRMVTSAVVMAELSFAAAASARPAQNRARLDAMLARLDVIPFGEVNLKLVPESTTMNPDAPIEGGLRRFVLVDVNGGQHPCESVREGLKA